MKTIRLPLKTYLFMWLSMDFSNMLYLMIYLNHFIISVHGALTVMHMLLYLYA